MTRPQKLRGELLLLGASLIWGFAFVAQRAGMEHLGPFTFNAARFALGAVVIAPIAWVRRRRRPAAERTPPGLLLRGGLAVGLALFAGATFQQAGLVWTTAGNAGFITGLYVLFVPLVGLALGHRTPRVLWGAAALAVAGLYLLAVQEGLRLGRGDALELAGALCWAGHVLSIDRVASRIGAFELAAGQFTVAALLSLPIALAVETTAWANLVAAAIPLLYAGLLSAGIAFTLQVAGQRHTPPGPTAILLSLEAVFAALGGIWLLGEPFTMRLVGGGGLILAAVLLAQLPTLRGRRRPPPAPGMPRPPGQP